MQRIASTRRWSWAVLAVLDAAILVLAALLAAWIRFNPSDLRHELASLVAHPGFIAYALAVELFLSATFDLYRPDTWQTRERLLVRLAALAVALPVGLALGVYLVMPWRFGRGLLALSVLFAVPAQGLLRLVWLAVATIPQPLRAVLVGEGPIVRALLEELERRVSPPFVIARRLSTDHDHARHPIVDETVAGADLVIVASMVPETTLDRLAELNFRGTTVVDAAGAYAALTGRIPVLQVDSRWFIATGDFSSLASSPFHNVQRLLDVVVAVVLLVVTSPLLLAAALAVLATSGLPILYRQTRLGRFGRPFVLFKLRTMHDGADEDGPDFATDDDERVLAVGRLMRRWRIDELPQLVNVLRGEMSLVGPRPERPEIARRLEREIPFFAFRYSVRPGITGWAQVNVPYCATTEENLVKLEYDLYSLRHHGPAMYTLVLVRTLGALVFQPGR